MTLEIFPTGADSSDKGAKILGKRVVCMPKISEKFVVFHFVKGGYGSDLVECKGRISAVKSITILRDNLFRLSTQIFVNAFTAQHDIAPHITSKMEKYINLEVVFWLYGQPTALEKGIKVYVCAVKNSKQNNDVAVHIFHE